MFRDFTFIYSDIVVRIVSGSNDAIFFLDMNSVKKFIGRGIPQFTIMSSSLKPVTFRARLADT